MGLTTRVPLASLLKGIESLHNLRDLVAFAGGTPQFTWLPSEGWVDHDPPRRAAVVGRQGGFEWLAFETAGAAGLLADRLARRLERGARLAGIMVLAPASRMLALSVSLPPRPVLTIDLSCPTPLVLSCLERLAGPGAHGELATASLVAQALDGEAVGRRFFRAFQSTLQQATDCLPARMPAAERHGAALLQLTRILFLYFVQAKGWLDGRPAFLREEMDRVLARQGEPHCDLLHPLFFGTLNQPVERRGSIGRSFGRVPFLNGGLFEPHALERRWGAALPASFWQSAFDDLFERFHFTPREGDSDRIAPDMLGRVFEGVMDLDERSGSGTFYTPAPLVQGLLRATLAAHVAVRLRCSDAEAERRLEAPDPALAALLDQVTILDPACGSGAFLLGALEFLSASRKGPALAVRQRILARNLFGVDRNPAAVRLSELRLWLGLIAVDSAEDPAEVAPLPNLDSLVRQGDSLLEPLVAGWGGRLPAATAVHLGTLRRQLLVATGRAKSPAIGALRTAEAAAAADMLSGAASTLRARIADLVAQGRSATLFGGRHGLDRRQQHVLESLRTQRRFVLSLRRHVVREGTLPWFHFQTQFAEAFAVRGGFDVIVGNPPWVRSEAVPASVRSHLAVRYQWYAAPSRASGYGNRPDLSVAFLERAIELLAPNGTVGFLLPGKLATTQYGAVAREALASQTTIHCVCDLGRDPRAVFEATVYPLGLIASRQKPSARHLVRLLLEPSTPPDLPQARMVAGPWVLASAAEREARERLLASGPPLGTRFRIHLGVKTGLNQVFIDPSAGIEPELLYWAIRGRDLRPFGTQPRLRLLWTHAANGRPLPSLPPHATSYLARYRDQLRRRRDYAGGPEWTLFRTGPASAPHRVVWADLARRLEACALTGPGGDRLIPLNTCYLIAAPSTPMALRLAAWLNSTWMRALASLGADLAAGGFRRFKAGVVSELPLPYGVLEDVTLSGLALAGQSGTLCQASLDEACARHLPLSPKDRDALAATVGAPGTHRR
jgi:hypothetical protein